MVPRFKAASVLATILFFSFQLQAQRMASSFDRSANTLMVTVRDSKNQPVADARVDVRATMGGQGLIPAGYTNRAGVYEVSNVPDGMYEVVAQKNLMQSSDRIEVGGGTGMVALRMDDQHASEAGGQHSVSVAQYQVPKKAREEFKKAQNAVEERKLDEAEKRLAKALEIHPEYAEALTLRGIINMDNKNYETAIEALDHAVKADPGYPLAYMALGAAFNMTQRYDEALRTLDRGVALEPRSWQGYFEIGKAKVGKADYAGAIRSLDKAENLAQGKYPLVHLVKAHAMLAMKNYPDAMNELQAFLDQAPKASQADSARETLDQVKAFVARQ